MRLSAHYVFEVHVSTPAESDAEYATVDELATNVATLAAETLPEGYGVTVGDPERN